MAAVPFFLPLVSSPLPLFPVSSRLQGDWRLDRLCMYEAFESAFQIGLVLKKCYSNLSSVSRNIVSHCLKLVQCALIEMLLDTLHLRGLCFTQSNSKIGKLYKRSYGAHWNSSSCLCGFLMNIHWNGDECHLSDRSVSFFNLFFIMCFSHC
jgi:hypothetical protein